MIHLNKQRLHRIIKESVNKVLNEGVYGYPDDIDMIILCAKNDRDCYDLYENLFRMVAKKYARGVELDVDFLANSSLMKKYQQFCFRKFKNEQGIITKSSPYNFRRYMAERMIEDIKLQQS